VPYWPGVTSWVQALAGIAQSHSLRLADRLEGGKYGRSKPQNARNPIVSPPKDKERHRQSRMLPTVDILVTSNKNFGALLRRCFKQATIEKPEQPSVWAVRTRCPCSSNKVPVQFEQGARAVRTRTPWAPIHQATPSCGREGTLAIFEQLNRLRATERRELVKKNPGCRHLRRSRTGS